MSSNRIEFNSNSKIGFIKEEPHIIFKDELDSCLQNEARERIKQELIKYDEQLPGVFVAPPEHSLFKPEYLTEVDGIQYSTDFQYQQTSDMSKELKDVKNCEAEDPLEQRNRDYHVSSHRLAAAEKELPKPELPENFSLESGDLKMFIIPQTCETQFKFADEHGAAKIYNLAPYIGTCSIEIAFKCGVCSYNAMTKKTLIKHIKAHEKRSTKSEMCWYRSTHGDTLEADSKPHAMICNCDIREHSSRTIKNLPPHISNEACGKQHKCTMCSYSSGHKSTVIRHIRIHTQERPFKCEYCDYRSATKNSLVRHTRTHTGEKPFQCEVCGYSAPTKPELVRHNRTHTGEKPFKCEICTYSASEKSTLAQHTRTHTGEKPFKCTHCDYSASSRSTLTQHMFNHAEDKPFKCVMCKYSAAVKIKLVRHMRTHIGERPYKCELCGYSAFIRSKLGLHMRIHTGERPFKCELCDYSAATKSCLIVHLRTHTGEKPFSCELCDYSTTRKAYLVRHMNSHKRKAIKV